MIKLIEDKLDKLDAYFAKNTANSKWIMILGITTITVYIGYAYLMPYTASLFQKSERDKQTVQKSIADQNTYLNSITVNGDREYYVKKYTQDIIDKKNQANEITQKIKLIDTNLEKLSDLLFNQKSWSKFLNSITNTAEVQNVDVGYITNHYVDNNGSFGHVLEIGVGCKGEYKNIIKFMNELEQNILVTDIFQSSLVSDKYSLDTIVDINISVWGINH
ncbi:MAG: hypothetical protein RL113_126 [Pseudomonadota bacterium]|jgi:hypothetical protein